MAVPTIQEVEDAFPSSMEMPTAIRRLYESYRHRDETGLFIASGVWAAPHDESDIAWHAGGDRMEGAFGRLFIGSQQIFCVWKAGSGELPVVCLPDGEEPWVLAENVLEFFRLLAIGYYEVVHEDFGQPPNPSEAGLYRLNPAFPKWVSETFDVTIPTTGREIVQKAQKEFAIDFKQYWQEHNDL